MSQKFPELFSFARDKHIVLAVARAQTPFHNLFHLPLSQQAHSQMLLLQNMLNEVGRSEDHDKWKYIWNSKVFSVKKTYKQLSGNQRVHPAFRWLWASACQCKHKVFFWLLMKDRISTRELLKRKNMALQDFTCVLCSNNTEESLLHLFLECPFAAQCWGAINIQIAQYSDPFEFLLSFRNQLGVPFFMEIIILMAWSIWKSRNDQIFRQLQPSFHGAKQFFKEEFQLLLLRIWKDYLHLAEQWIANLA